MIPWTIPLHFIVMKLFHSRPLWPRMVRSYFTISGLPLTAMIGTRLLNAAGSNHDSRMPPPTHNSSGRRHLDQRQVMISFEDRGSGAPHTDTLGPRYFNTRSKCTRGIVSVTVEEIVASLILLRPGIVSCEWWPVDPCCTIADAVQRLATCRITWRFPLLDDYELLIFERIAHDGFAITHTRRVPLIECDGYDWLYLLCTPAVSSSRSLP